MYHSNRFRTLRRLALLLLIAGASSLVAHANGPAAPPPDAAIAPVPQPERPRIEVAFVLDTTGSMSGLIEGAKREIWSIANRMASGAPTPEIRIGLVAYRDRGDAYVTRTTDLTDDLDAVYARLTELTADGGGDTPESVNQALHEAVTGLAWSPGQDAYKVIFLVGDAPPHEDYQDDVPSLESAELARSEGIAVNTIQCGSYAATTPVWRAIARAGLGEFAAIRQDGAMVAVATPVDDELARKGRELAETVVAYGTLAEREETEAKVDRSLAAEPGVAASRLSYLAKSGGGATSGRGDLVDAVRRGEVDADDLPAEILPEALRARDADARRAYVEEQAARRESLERDIARLAAKRDAYLKERAASADETEGGAGFDREVLETIRAQAAAKGIAYD